MMKSTFVNSIDNIVLQMNFHQSLVRSESLKIKNVFPAISVLLKYKHSYSWLQYRNDCATAASTVEIQT